MFSSDAALWHSYLSLSVSKLESCPDWEFGTRESGTSLPRSYVRLDRVRAQRVRFVAARFVIPPHHTESERITRLAMEIVFLNHDIPPGPGR